MSESKLKKEIKVLNKQVNLDNFSSAVTTIEYLNNNSGVSDSTKKRLETLHTDIQNMVSAHKVNHMKLQQEIGTLYMFA